MVYKHNPVLLFMILCVAGLLCLSLVIAASHEATKGTPGVGVVDIFSFIGDPLGVQQFVDDRNPGGGGGTPPDGTSGAGSGGASFGGTSSGNPGSGALNALVNFLGGGPEASPGPSVSPPPAQPGSGNPQAIDCSEFEGTPFSIGTFGEGQFDADGKFIGGSAEDLQAQLCAFFASEGGAAWQQIKGDEAAQQNFVQAFNTQYGTNLLGVESIGAWEGNTLTLEDGTSVNLDLNAYYGESNAQRDFSFRGTDGYTYDRQPIRDIIIGEDGVNMVFGDSRDNGGQGQSQITVPKGASFNPQDMTLSYGENTITWNGQGIVGFEEGRLTLDFAQGASDTDITNFPIMRLADGTELSPYQIRSSVKPGEGVTAPDSGFRAFSQDGKQYTIDSEGIVREITSTSLEFGSNGALTSVANGLVGSLGADLYGELAGSSFFAQGLYGLGRNSGVASYVDITDGKLTINNEAGNTMYFTQHKDLGALDVTGEGAAYLRNGDYVLQFRDNKISYKKLPESMQKSGGRFAYAIGAISNSENPENPFSIKREGESLTFVDSQGKAVAEGVITQPPQPEDDGDGGDGGTIPGSNPRVAQELQRDYQVSEDGSSVRTYFRQVSQQGEFINIQTTISGLDSLPEGLTQEEFAQRLLGEGLTFESTILFVENTPVDVPGIGGFRQEMIANGLPASVVDQIIAPIQTERAIGIDTIDSGKTITFTIQNGVPQLKSGSTQIQIPPQQRDVIVSQFAGTLTGAKKPDGLLYGESGRVPQAPPSQIYYEAYLRQNQ